MQLVSEYNYYKSKETLTDDGFFYSTIEHLENETCLSGHEQRKAINALCDLNIIKVVSKGIPAKRHFKINFEEFARLFDRIEKTGSKQRNFKISKILTASNKKSAQQDSEIFNTNNKIYNNEIERLIDYINSADLTETERNELEQEFQRLQIDLSDDYIEILSKSAYKRVLFMRAGIVSIFCTPHKYKLKYIDSKRLMALYDRYAETETKSTINEPIQYFRKMITEYLDNEIII